MAKKIIILNRLNEPSDMTFRYAMWAVVPAARVSAYANATATSAYSGATAAELLAIQNGQVTERVVVWQATAAVPIATIQAATAAVPIATIQAALVAVPIATIQAALVAEFAKFQAEINARNPTGRFGTFWDGATWTLGGTA